MPELRDSYREAANAISKADALIITAGAGMGVDSGLPDFRGTTGFWNAYPHAKELGLSFADLANPKWFADDPSLAWGFYGHRAALYQSTPPHPGFEILHRWAGKKPHGAFIFTSNVDGHFHDAGFAPENVWECHGSIRFLQCSSPCSDQIWPLEPDAIPSVDLETFRATSPLPTCPHCDAIARPNILMFGDSLWIPSRYFDRESAFQKWAKPIQNSGLPLAILEIGAGTGVPTVRHFSEMKSSAFRATLIRINPRESHLNDAYRGISLPASGLDAIRTIQAELDIDSR